MKKNLIWLILTMMPWVTSAQLTDKYKVNRSDITITGEDGFDRIRFGNSYTGEVGNPELPVVRRSFVIPPSAVVSGLEVVESERRRIDGSFRVYPVQPPKTSGERNRDDEPFFQSDSIYRSTADFPGDTAVISFDGMVRGYHVITISYYPLIYIPAKSELYMRDIEISVSYSLGNSVVSQAPISYYRANLAKQFVRSMVENPSDVDRYDDVFRVISQRTSLNPEPGNPRLRSVNLMEEIVPDYIIITSDSLRESFQKLADWKTKKGIPTIIQSVEEINFQYPGGDLQEKIRNYLLNVRKRWNAEGMYVLFGGDVNVVPVRSYRTYQGMQVTDTYYVANQLNWTPHNGKLDFRGNKNTPFNSGRIPVKNKKEADNFIRKIISYERASETGVDYNYLNNSLIVDAFMDKNENGIPCEGYMKMVLDYCQGKPASFWYMFDHFNCTKNDHLLNGDYHAEQGVELSRANLLSALKNDKVAINAMFHFVYHMDHSVPTVLGSSTSDKGESLSINDVEGAVFTPKYYQVIMSGSCHPADFSKDCIAEHLLNKVDAGAVAFIGNTDIGQYHNEEVQLDRLYRHLYNTGPSVYGQFSLGYLRLKAVDCGDKDVGYQEMRLHLLGDPEMPLWTRKPTDLLVNVSPSTLSNKTDTIWVSISGIPWNQQAMICLKKDDEGYATRIVDSDGLYMFSFTPYTSGKIDVTVTSQNCRPYETQLTVNGGSSSVCIHNVDLNDDPTDGGTGNGDGRMDAGEKVKMRVMLRNNGPKPINITSGILSCSSKYIKLHSNVLSFGTINPGTIRISNNNALFTINDTIDATQILKNDLNAIRFTMQMYDQAGNVYVDTFKIDVYAPELQLRQQRVIGRLAAGTENGLYINLMNVGESETGKLTAWLSPDGNSSNVISCGDTIIYESISPKNTLENNLKFRFKVGSQYSSINSSLRMKLEVKNAHERVWTFYFDPNDRGPVIPSNSLGYLSQDDNIELFWPSNSLNYNLYRSESGINGLYEKLNRYPLASGYYKDELVSQGKVYYYKLAAMSASGNEGPKSAPLQASVSLPLMKGFPQFFPDSRNIQGSVCVADVDYDGKKELFYAQRNFNNGRHGILMGFRPNGEEVFDIDRNPSTVSGFAQLSETVWGTPAIGDLKGDGEQKIITATRDEKKDTELNSVTCFAARDNNRDYRPDQIWQRKPELSFYRGAVLSNLDNSSDGSMEVILRSDGAQPIRILGADGNLKYSFGTGGLSMPAVADLDGDGKKEIVVGCNDGIYIWKYNGTPFTRNPFYTQAGYLCGSSPVICDLNKDGIKEILFTAKKEETNGLVTSMVCVLKPDGTKLTGWNGSQTVNVLKASMPHEIAVGDIDLDGKPEVAVLGVNRLKVWKSDGSLLFYKNIDLDSPNKISVVIADVNGDAYPEIVFGIGRRVYALDRYGNDVPGFPLVTENEFVASVYVGDIDKDGKNELVAVDSGDLYAWKTKGNPEIIEWGSERHDPWNTGEYAPICEPTLILGSQYWNGVTPCGNVIIQSGRFIISLGDNLILDKTSKIIVRSGSTLEVDGGTVSNAYILALPGSKVTVKNGGKINLRGGGYLDIRQGAEFDFQSGTLN